MKVLIAVDDSKIAEKAFDWYVSHLHKEGSEVVVCHEADQPEFPTVGLFAGAVAFPQEEINRIVGEHRQRLQKLAEKYAEKCKAAQLSYKVFVDTVEGGAGNGILKRAEKVEANMIVIGTRGQGAVRRTILGSISDYVLHHAKIPVVVCHA